METGGPAVLALGVAAGGALVGATLPTLVYRLSVDWEAPLKSKCGACGAPLPVGVRGWLRFSARCGSCGARTGPRPWLVAAVTGVACAGIAVRFGNTPTVIPFLLIVPLACLLGAVDLVCLRLPEVLVLPGIGATVALFAGLAAYSGHWGQLGRALLGGLAFGGAYLVLALLPGGQLGLGDVTLGALLGVYLGWLGWPFVVLGAVVPFLVHAPVVIGLLIAGRAGRKSELPFGPAMLVGAYLSVVGPPGLVALFVR